MAEFEENRKAAVEAKKLRAVEGCQTARATARTLIMDRIARNTKESEQLQALLDCLPSKMPLAADEALWSLLLKR